jgi:hypothetical protein
MNQQPMMAGMNPGGGPVGPVPMNNPAMVAAAAANAANNVAMGGQPPAPESRNPQNLLNTYIYDYFIKNHHFDLARTLKDTVEISIDHDATNKLNQRNVNGVGGDSKDDIHKRPTDLPVPNIPTAESDSSFILEWWSQFWDIFSAHRGKDKANPATISYLAHARVSSSAGRVADDGSTNLTQDQSRARHQNQRMMTQMDPSMMNQYRLNMMGGQNGNMVDLQKRALANSRNVYVPPPSLLLGSD